MDKAMKILLFHQSHGCETGCCGHVVAWFPEELVASGDFDYDSGEDPEFLFAHPRQGESLFEFAKRLVRDQFGEEHVKDLDFENSYVLDYC